MHYLWVMGGELAGNPRRLRVCTRIGAHTYGDAAAIVDGVLALPWCPTPPDAVWLLYDSDSGPKVLTCDVRNLAVDDTSCA